MGSGRGMSGETKGPYNEIPCPCCDAKIDLSDLIELIEVAAVFECDQCNKKVWVTNSADTTIVSLNVYQDGDGTLLEKGF